MILYELLTGALPFEGSPWMMLGQIVTQQPKPPSQHNPQVDPRLEAICVKAMAKQIEDRYASMAELSEALKEYLSAAETTTPASTSPDQTVEPAKKHEANVVSVIEVASGPRQGEKFDPVKDRVVIGRHPDCDICFDVFAISRLHAQFVTQSEQIAFSNWSWRMKNDLV